MRPIAAEHGGGGGGSEVGLWALGAVERGRRSDTEVGLDNEHARRQHRDRSMTKDGGGGGGGVEEEEEVPRHACGRIF
jgi:hypothetical protein